MQNAAWGLKSVFKSITNNVLMRQLFEKHAPSAQVDWNLPRNALPEALFKACDELRRKSKQEYANLICTLQEVCDICADVHSPERLTHALNDAGLMKRFTTEIKKGHRELQNATVWMHLNAPEIWSHLLLSAKALHIHAKTWDEYRVFPCNRPRQESVTALSASVTDYLVKETLHGEHIHIELDENGDCFRYLVSVNNFPVNVQQFDRQGDYAIARDINALNFMFEYAHESHVVRIKCSFDAKKRRDLAAIFAETVLHSELISNDKTKLNLSRHLDTRILPLANSSAIVSARQTGLTTSFRDQRGKRETCTLTTQGNTNLQVRMKSCLDLFGIPHTSVLVEEVLYEIDIRGINGGIKKINAKIATDGFHFTCRDRGDRQLIANYLQQAVS